MMDAINNRVLYFKNKIVNNFDDLDLANFYSNILTLKVKKSSNEVYGKLKIDVPSTYDYEKNVIIIDKHKIDDYCLYHELFHLASNSFIKDNDMVGFYQYDHKKNLGQGLNEGYTELLTRRYFGKNNDSYSYEFEVIIAKCLEDIIGMKKMQSLYLRADLANLIGLLSKYVKTDDVIQFIKDLDYVSSFIFNTEYQKTIIQKVNDINKFIVTLRLKKYYNNYNKILIRKLKVNYDANYFNKFNLIQDRAFFQEVIKYLNDNHEQKNI